MKKLGFEKLNTNANLFIYKEENLIVVAIIDVDNALFCGPLKALVKKVKAAFMKKWECHIFKDGHEFL